MAKMTRPPPPRLIRFLSSPPSTLFFLLLGALFCLARAWALPPAFLGTPTCGAVSFALAPHHPASPLRRSRLLRPLEGVPVRAPTRGGVGRISTRGGGYFGGQGGRTRGVLAAAGNADIDDARRSPSSPTVVVHGAATLASSYVVHVTEELHHGHGTSGDGHGHGHRGDSIEVSWRLLPLPEVEREAGAAAVRALRAPFLDSPASSSALLLRCRCHGRGSDDDDDDDDDDGWSISVTVEEDYRERGGDDDDDNLLVSVLSRIMVQGAARRIAESAAAAAAGAPWTDDDSPCTVSLPGGDGKTTVPGASLAGLASASSETMASLFGSVPDATTDCEMVDVVDASGSTLGVAPRPLVHRLNLLHRGVGIVVCRDSHIPRRSDGQLPEPDVYVHRRTDTKRIFPSLYDMFVGGVSLAGEDPRLTAAREVSEELGLSRALPTDSGGDDALSDPLFDCTVCTSYNRCVVTVFTYKCLSGEETVRWQEEEVAWGEFVDYRTVGGAAGLSIGRLRARGEWPGTGSEEEGDDGGGGVGGIGGELVEGKGEVEGDEEEDWRAWDFVPDGLLVWEAWVHWRGDGGSAIE